MDAVKDYKEVEDLIKDTLERRKFGNEFEDVLIEDFVDYLNGHLAQINRYISINGDRISSIKKKKKSKTSKK